MRNANDCLISITITKPGNCGTQLQGRGIVEHTY